MEFFLCWPLSVHSTPGDQVQLLPTRCITWTKPRDFATKPFSIYLEADRLEGIIGANGQDRLEKGEVVALSDGLPRLREPKLWRSAFWAFLFAGSTLLVEKMPERFGGHAIGVLSPPKAIISGHLPVRRPRERILSAEEAGIKVGDLNRH